MVLKKTSPSAAEAFFPSIPRSSYVVGTLRTGFAKEGPGGGGRGNFQAIMIDIGITCSAALDSEWFNVT